MEFTADNLQSRPVDELINIILNQQKENSELISRVNNLSNDMDLMKDEVYKLKAAKGNHPFSEENVKKRISDVEIEMEKRLNNVEQYSRRDCVEFVGLPTGIPDRNSLKELLVKVFAKANLTVTRRDFHAAHYMHDGKTVIAKMVVREDADDILRSKMVLRELSPQDKVELGVAGTLYVNASLCPAYRVLLGKCNSLYKARQIGGFYTVYGKLLIRHGGTSLRNGNYTGGETTKVEHITDLEDALTKEIVEKFAKKQ